MSVQTDLEARTAQLQQVLTGANSAITDKGGTAAQSLTGLPDAINGLTGGNLEEGNVTPTGEELTVTPGEGYDGFSSVTVAGDENLTPQNIADGITIYGVAGTLKVGAAGTLPEEYEPYLEHAKLLYTGEYANYAVSENNDYLNIIFLMPDFTVTEYNTETTAFAATGWVLCRYQKSGENWDVSDYRETDNTIGGNYVKNIRFSTVPWEYNGSVIWPMSSGGGGTSADSVRTETVVALEAVSKGNVVYISGGDTEFTKDEADLPEVLPTNTGRGVAFNSDGTRCVVVHDNSPYMLIYDTTTTPWTKLSNPDTLPASDVQGVAFNPSGIRCVVAHSGSPYMSIYDTTTTPWTKLSNPDTLPAGIGQGVAFNSDGTRCVVGHNSSPYMSIYDTTTTPWTKLSNPDTLPASDVQGVAFNPDGTRCVVAHGQSPYMSIYDTTTTPWTKLSNPDTLPASAGWDVAFNPSGTRCVVVSIRTPYMLIYDTTTTPWTKLSNPDTLPTNEGYGVAFNSDGTRCVVAHGQSPYMSIYDTTTTPWTKLSNPDTLPASAGWGVAFNPSGIRCVVAHSGSPYMSIYAITNGKPVAYNSNNQLTSNINVRYGIATKDAAANEELTAEIILDN